MARHLKTIIYSGLTSTVFTAVPSPAVSTRHARGVRYLTPIDALKIYCGIMDSHKQGHKYRKHIIVRRAPRFKGLHQLYTYHFPKTWSAGCVANRELIKEAQRQAHALEHDYSHAGIEWRIRFFKHYYRVFKGGDKPEPGLKPYSRFYQYTYVSIYRQLQAARDAALSLSASQNDSSASLPTADDVTFDPIEYRPLRSYRPASSFQNAVERVSAIQKDIGNISATDTFSSSPSFSGGLFYFPNVTDGVRVRFD